MNAITFYRKLGCKMLLESSIQHLSGRDIKDCTRAVCHLDKCIINTGPTCYGLPQCNVLTWPLYPVCPLGSWPHTLHDIHNRQSHFLCGLNWMLDHTHLHNTPLFSAVCDLVSQICHGKAIYYEIRQRTNEIPMLNPWTGSGC